MAFPSFRKRVIARPVSRAGPVMAIGQRVFVDSAGNRYVGESDGHRVCRSDPRGILTKVAGTGQQGLARPRGREQ